MWLATKMSLTFFFVLLVIVSSLWYITTYKVAILIIPDAIYSVQGMHSSYTHKCCGVYPMFLFYIYMYKCGKKTVVSFWDQKVISMLYNSNLQQVAALPTYTKNTRKKVLDLDACCWLWSTFPRRSFYYLALKFNSIAPTSCSDCKEFMVQDPIIVRSWNDNTILLLVMGWRLCWCKNEATLIMNG